MIQARLIVTGSRAHTDRELIRSALAVARWDLGPLIVVHGAAPGADSIASEWARSLSYLDIAEERHPADWAKLGRGAGPIRNQQMVDAGAVLCLAFPLHGAKGTRDCMRRAAAAGIPVREYPPVPKETARA